MVFLWGVNNVELTMKLKKKSMTGCRDIGKKHKKCPQKGAFSLLFPCGTQTSFQKLEKLMGDLRDI